MSATLHSTRLQLQPLSIDDFAFITALVNSPGWIQFIGDRNVHSDADAKAYIQRILDNPDIHYWTVKLQGEENFMGVVTLIKRDYLEHSDIGFAFLPEYAKNGYAYEATATVLKQIVKAHTHILATTLPENQNSIRLLEKLGFHFDKEINPNSETLWLYSLETHKISA